MKVALVVMPWWKVELMPLGAATLKSVLNAEGVEADCLYLNMKMAERIGPMAHLLSDGSIFSEWFFAYHLFGPGGTGELTEDLADVLRFIRRPSSAMSSPNLQAGDGISDPQLKKLLHEDLPAFLDECLDAIPWESYDLIGFSTLLLQLHRQPQARAGAQGPISRQADRVRGRQRRGRDGRGRDQGLRLDRLCRRRRGGRSPARARAQLGEGQALRTDPRSFVPPRRGGGARKRFGETL